MKNIWAEGMAVVPASEIDTYFHYTFKEPIKESSVLFAMKHEDGSVAAAIVMRIDQLKSMLINLNEHVEEYDEKQSGPR